MTRVITKMTIRALRVIKVTRSITGTMRITARRVVILMAKTGDTAVAAEVAEEVAMEVAEEVDTEVITKEWATYGYSRNTSISALQFQCLFSSEITCQVIAAHSTIVLTLYLMLLWIKEGR
jgi:hypothetical protein